MNNTQSEQMTKQAIEGVRAFMSNKIARCYFTHNHDEDTEGRITCYFSGTVETGPFGFWVQLGGEVIADSTVGNGELPSFKIVEPCQRAAAGYLNYRS
jgi:hypothetical protein